MSTRSLLVGLGLARIGVSPEMTAMRQASSEHTRVASSTRRSLLTSVMQQLGPPLEPMFDIAAQQRRDDMLRKMLSRSG